MSPPDVPPLPLFLPVVVTMRVAGLLVAEPAGLVAMQRYWVPFIVVVTALRVSAVVVAPEMFAQAESLAVDCH